MPLSAQQVLDLADWMLDEALAERDVGALMEGLCRRLLACGLPVARARVSWPTLHPLFQAETIRWRPEDGLTTERFPHQDTDSEEWRASPVKWMLDHDVTFLHERLEGDLGPDAFLLMHELKEQGYSDIVAFTMPIFPKTSSFRGRLGDFGIYVTYSTREKGGFSDGAIEVFRQLLRPLALAARSAAYPRLIASVADTYLGPTVAREVLSGRIRLGSGSRTRALVWYSDLRNSTRLAETMGEDAYLALLNDYFDCTGRAAVEAGGEIMAFIGDAVLAIFPIEADSAESLDEVAGRGRDAARAALAAAEAVNARRTEAGSPTIQFGVAMDIGEVRFGNIGIAQRLSFSIVGPTVNEVERMERMTKILGAPVLATEAIAGRDARSWRRLGSFPLEGMARPVTLYGLRAAAVGGNGGAAAPVPARE